MAIIYPVFVEKYSIYSDLAVSRFEIFLADALLEIEQYQWGTLKDKATELLLCHLLAIASPQDKSSTPLESFRVDDEGYQVRYQKPSGDFSSTVWGAEYQRLLKQAIAQTEVSQTMIAPKPSHYHSTRNTIQYRKWS